MSNWAKKLKRNVQQLLEGGNWGKNRQNEKNYEEVRDKLAPAVQTKKIMKDMKATGKSDDEISAITGISKEQLASISESDRKELAKHFGKKK
jgi:hypothetical protein